MSYIAALRRVRASPAPAVPAPEVCEFCALPLPAQHEHVITLATGDLNCACTACALLFDRAGQPQRRLPRDAHYLAGFDLDPLEWASLMIPVKLAFIASGAAHYPSPGGVVTAPIEPELWNDILARHSQLQRLQPGLEALFINYLDRPHQIFIAPLDQCYRLAALVRQHWTGFSGGPAVRRDVRDFCAHLRGEVCHA